MSAGPPWIGAAEASRLLNVSRATLYAYVSRGYVRSQSAGRSTRHRRYSREDVERWRRRSEERRDPDRAAAHALQWGVPVLESSITLIDGRRLFYRGHDAIALAGSRSVREVASLIWTGRFDALHETGASRPVAIGPSGSDTRLSFVALAQSRLARASADDSAAFDLRPTGVVRTGWRIVTLLTVAATGTGVTDDALERDLARRWRVNARGRDVLRSALILCADHELNVSSFTARSVASAGSNPYAVVMAGLSALEGVRHGGTSARVESMLESMRRSRSIGQAIAERLRRGETIDGFGHPLYRSGDPRAAALMTLLAERYARSPELEFVAEVAERASSALLEHANIDFALAAAARVLRLPPGSPLTVFAIGRSIGWIGHALEQYATGQLIRPRAKYVGPPPLE